MTTAKRIYLLRHGETHENLDGILQGQRFGTLNERGLRQVKYLAARLKDEPVGRILTSDLERALVTARAIGKFHSCVIEPKPFLRERGLGVFEGHPVATLERAFEEARADRLRFVPEGGESVEEVRLRAAEVRSFLLSEDLPAVTVVVAHGLFNRALLGLIREDALESVYEIEQENSCVNLLLRRDNTLSIELVNCTSHLPQGELTHRGKVTY